MKIKAEKEIYNLPHNCGLVALRYFVPDIPVEKFIESFHWCCKEWPYGPVKDGEMFKVMDVLKIRDVDWFNCTKKNVAVKDLLDGGGYLILIRGHYTVVASGKKLEKHISKSEGVICYWKFHKFARLQRVVRKKMQWLYKATAFIRSKILGR